ncbi:unnamed protein product (macronuclear) [Paramecium tetraurelia]|uniref:TNFR-Cys domain-containing protein n=1 Tax=Paramecium tetraurelia TaxID=5888 RepID=A0CTR9_PARTE|nr:uncharacterized protein GSPATT00010420001 [Paramecium tetraurelia]CAK74186.1 unnamed protein product [Paramecium tetraurelia]|eukprot:XP_001441583.1 hypothetical protein (macronuclear) [Paramecium tetraurelia strain d4-2]
MLIFLSQLQYQWTWLSLIIDNLCYSICGDKIITQDEQCDDGNFIIGDGCHLCQFNCQDSCLYCLQGICYDCQEGYQLIQSKCYSICGDGLQKNNEQCDINSSLQIYQNCQSCQLTCNLNCLLCQLGICYQCKDGYELSSNKKYCIKSLEYSFMIIEYCHIQIGNSCIQCEDYVYFENFEYMCNLIVAPQSLCQQQLKLSPYLDSFTNTCIIDYNMNKCPKTCKKCVHYKCLECEFGYYGNQCMPKCGDGIIVQEEECDDRREYELDTCLNCKFYCPQYCEFCAYGICTNCISGFYLDIVSNSCNSVCGDKILASDEACDDGNDLKYDGCYQCKYQCQTECLDCQFGQCTLCESPLILIQSKSICEQLASCEDLKGLYYDNQSNDCFTQCGDGIVAGNEYCDDKNDVPYDGCYECKFQCTLYCQICNQGECFQCQNDYTLQNNQCSFNKENDDLNLSNTEETQNNNASNNNNTSYGQNPEWLSLNENMLCRGYECVYSKKPSMKLTYKTQSFALQYVDITFDQEVKFSDEVQKDKNLFNISINDLDSQYYNIKINSIQDISFDLQHAQYQVQIELFLELQTKPVLLVQLNQEIINGNNQSLFNSNQSITLQTPKIMSEQLKQVSNYAQQSNKAFMIGAISICVISLVSGESSFVVETLNLLQYQSFLRFINVEYPENLYIYFQAQELLSISSYLQLFQFDDYLNLITRKEKQIDLNGKFQQYNVEADLFTNILPQLIQFLVLVTLLYFAENLYNILFRLIKYLRHLKNEKTSQSKILFVMINLILVCKNCFKSLMKTRYLQNYDQIIQLIYVNSWDLIFKVILQLHYIQIDNLRSFLSTFSASLIIFACISILLKSFSLCSDPQEKYFIEQLDIKFITLDISRTLFFHVVLILFQEQQILQFLLISLSNIAQCYIIYQYKQCSYMNRIIFLTTEGVLTVFSLSQFLYFDIGQLYISYKSKITLGFIHMGFLIMSLGIVCVKQLFPFVKNIWKLVFKGKKVKVASSQLFS